MPLLFSGASTAREVAQHLASYIRHKTILVTGCTPGGVGFEAALNLARHSPKLLIISNRSEAKGDEAVSLIRAEVPNAPVRSLVVDMSLMADVKRAAAEVNGYDYTVDVLIHNAAVAGLPPSKTTENNETTFATNHLGPFLMTSLLLPKMLSGDRSPRIVAVTGGFISSLKDWPWDDPQCFDTSRGVERYTSSKAANVMFAGGLARKSNGRIQAFSTSPGRIQTGLSRHLTQEQLHAMGFLNADGTKKTEGFSSLEQGAASYILAAFDPDLSHTDNGGYISSACQVATGSLPDFLRAPESEDKLWALSEQIIGEPFFRFGADITV